MQTSNQILHFPLHNKVHKVCHIKTTDTKRTHTDWRKNNFNKSGKRGQKYYSEGHVRRRGNGVTLETREIRQTFITEQSRIGNKTVPSLKLLRFSGWRRLRSLHTVTLCVCVCVCVQFRGATGTNAAGVEKERRRRRRRKKLGLTKLVLATTAVLVEMLLM